jgi:signal transduction histidine kinase
MTPPTRRDVATATDRCCRRQEIVMDLARRALECGDVDRHLRDVVQTVADTLRMECVSVLACCGANEVTHRHALGWNERAQAVPTVSLDGERGIGAAVRTTDPVIVELDPPADPGSDRLAAQGVESGLCVAIGDEPWGVLEAYTGDRREYHPEELTFLRRVADVVSSALKGMEENGSRAAEKPVSQPEDVATDTRTYDRSELLADAGQTTVGRELRENNRTLKRLYEITADPDRSFEQKVNRLLDLGRERLGLDVGFLAAVDPERDRFEVEYAISGDDRLQAGATASLSETYCRRTIESKGLFALSDADAEGFGDHPAYERWDFDAYVGSKIPIDGNRYRTVCFADRASRAAFTPAERSFVELTSQWLGYELERERTYRELEAANERLETSNERLEQFAYAASHDLQEPLRMVTSYLTLIESRYGSAFDADGREFLGYAVDGADRMRNMIDGLLEYSRVESSGDPFEPVELDDVLEDVQSDLTMPIKERNAEITAASLPRVSGDPHQLRQLFQNLLSNALKYSGNGPPRVNVSAERADDRWAVAVRDNGIGMKPAEIDDIFELFERLHSHDEESGTGIGLALCQRIIERHGGAIDVDSEPGEGSTFTVMLPAATAD